MTTTQQIDDFTTFARTIAQQEGDEISLEEIYERWCDKKHANEDRAAIQEAHEAYERGERGRPVDEFLAEFNAKQAAGKKR